MKTLISVTLLFVSLSFFGQENQDVEKILKDFSEKTTKFSTIQAKFIFHHSTGAEGELDSFEGEIFIKDNKFKLIFPGNEIYSDGNTLWQYMADLNEVTITEKDKEDDSFLSNPKNIFTVYKDEFKYKFNKEYAENGKQLYEIDLFPQKLEESNYSRIRIKIVKTDLQLYSIEYFG